MRSIVASIATVVTLCAVEGTARSEGFTPAPPAQETTLAPVVVTAPIVTAPVVREREARPPVSAAQPMLGREVFSVPPLVVGASVTGAMWLIDLVSIVASIRCLSGTGFGISCTSFSGWIFIPVFGPWISYARVDPLRYDTDEARFYLASGIVQAAGLVLGVGLGYLVPALRPAPRQLTSAAGEPRAPRVAVLPAHTHELTGLTLVGSF